MVRAISCWTAHQNLRTMARVSDSSLPVMTGPMAAALEIVRRESQRSGRSLRAVLSLVRVSDPPTKAEQLLLMALRLLRSPHAIMPHPCSSFDDWLARYAPSTFHRRPQ